MNVVHTMLESAGHIVLKASSADDALERFSDADGCIDLLIADVRLPARSGVEVAVHLQALLPNLRVILTSGQPSDFWEHSDIRLLKHLQPEMLGFLAKPFLSSTLLNVVSNLIAGRATIDGR